MSLSGVFTIPPGAPFVDRLAQGLRALSGDDPLRLAACRVLLPNRRAGLTLREAFLRAADGAAVLLPRFGAIGEVDADELDLTLPDGLDLPPALEGMTRQMLLAALVARTDFAPTAAQAAQLAGQLARLLDQVGTERLEFSRLARLAPDRYADHWQVTLQFLTVLTDLWPAILAEQGAMDPARRRDQLLQALARQWQADPPADPVIAAGSTGSFPGAADLLVTIAGLPQGCVVLPGLDRHIPPEEWAGLTPTHPQYGLKQLLDRLGLAPDQVPDWPGAEAGQPQRARLLSLAMAPDPTRPMDLDPAAAVAGLSLMTCPNPQAEAAAIALALREVLETPGKRAALVTPDRDLARRVAAELHRLGVEIDDSAGQPLATTVPGVFLRLVVEAVQEELAPAPLLSLLKHPLCGLGGEIGRTRRAVRQLESALLRGPRPAAGIAGLRSAVADLAQTRDGQPLSENRLKLIARLTRLVETLALALAEITGLLDRPAVSLADLTAAHVRAAEALAATDTDSGADRLWAGVAGAEVANFVASLAEASPLWAGGVAGADYPALFGTLLADRAMRPPYGKHPRLAILGPIEARLQQMDRLVLGGLNEGSWPADPGDDPWMSRPMRADFGLPPLEQRIGQAAHDFAQAFVASEVILSRAERVDGTPTVPSRWLQRLTVALTALKAPPLHEAPWLAHVRTLEAPPAYRAGPMPAPCPPVSARPRRLSVTRIETLRRDPYAIYARFILKLKVLDPLDQPIDPAQRGTIIHAALEEFVRRHPGPLPQNALAQLLACGREAYGTLLDDPAIERFWWPQFERLADWLVAEEARRRPGLAGIYVEATGELPLEGLPGGTFVLEGRADRIECRRDGTLAVIDYKTGQPPAASTIALGYAPQLPLLGAMALAGKFRGVPEGTVAALEFWHLGSRPSVRPVTEPRKPADADYTDELIQAAWAGLYELIGYFDDPDTPYLPRVRPGAFDGDYDHLARTREWAVGKDEA